MPQRTRKQGQPRKMQTATPLSANKSILFGQVYFRLSIRNESRTLKCHITRQVRHLLEPSSCRDPFGAAGCQLYLFGHDPELYCHPHPPGHDHAPHHLEKLHHGRRGRTLHRLDWIEDLQVSCLSLCRRRFVFDSGSPSFRALPVSGPSLAMTMRGYQ